MMRFRSHIGLLLFLMLSLTHPGAQAQDTLALPVGQLNKKGDVAAAFPGGLKAWQTYLTEAFDRQVLMDTVLSKNIPAGQHQAIVRFVVDKNGVVSDVAIVRRIGFGVDDALVKIFRGAPAWNAATRKGKKVNSYHAQPFSFVLEEEE